MNYRSSLLFGLCFLFIYSLKAQDYSDCKYGEITAADFSIKTDKFDSGTNAIILTDICKVNFEETEGRNFNVINKRYLRILIINKNGLHAGQFTLHLYKPPTERSFFGTLPEQGLVGLKGITYNLENGQIRKDQLNRISVYTVKEGHDRVSEKFTMPALKEGSIFDIEFTVRSPSFITPINWEFQSAYPCLWSEYNLTLPEAYRYTIKYRGDSSFYIHNTELVTQVSPALAPHVELPMTHFRWVKINETAIYSEPYIGSLKNYVDGVSLQNQQYLKIYREKTEITTSTWDEFSYLYFLFGRMENFEIEKFNWMKKDLETVTMGLNKKNDLAKAVYRWVRDHYSCYYHQTYFASQSVKETFREKSGNVADINLLLTAMLRQVHIEADPAILSTVGNGFGNLKYPMLNDYNYMICVAKIDGKDVLLDASQPLNPYGKLQPDCYNGGAVTLSTKNCRLINLLPDSLCETNRTDVIITSDEKGILTGGLTIHCGTEKSHAIRKEIKNTSKKEFLSGFRSNSQIVKLSNEELDELDNPDLPITVHCDMDFPDSVKTDIIYLKPVILPLYKTNPFSSVKRKYIVEMPYRQDNIYLLTMDIPKGYRVEEMPSSALIRLNENDGSFEYTIEKNGDNIQLQARMKLNKTVFTTEEYSALRDFFINIIKKEDEHIVLRKVK